MERRLDFFLENLNYFLTRTKSLNVQNPTMDVINELIQGDFPEFYNKKHINKSCSGDTQSPKCYQEVLLKDFSEYLKKELDNDRTQLYNLVKPLLQDTTDTGKVVLVSYIQNLHFQTFIVKSFIDYMSDINDILLADRLKKALYPTTIYLECLRDFLYEPTKMIKVFDDSGTRFIESSFKYKIYTDPIDNLSPLRQRKYIEYAAEFIDKIFRHVATLGLKMENGEDVSYETLVKIQQNCYPLVIHIGEKGTFHEPYNNHLYYRKDSLTNVAFEHEILHSLSALFSMVIPEFRREQSTAFYRLLNSAGIPLSYEGYSSSHKRIAWNSYGAADGFIRTLWNKDHNDIPINNFFENITTVLNEVNTLNRIGTNIELDGWAASLFAYPSQSRGYGVNVDKLPNLVRKHIIKYYRPVLSRGKKELSMDSVLGFPSSPSMNISSVEVKKATQDITLVLSLATNIFLLTVFIAFICKKLRTPQGRRDINQFLFNRLRRRSRSRGLLEGGALEIPKKYGVMKLADFEGHLYAFTPYDCWTRVYLTEEGLGIYSAEGLFYTLVVDGPLCYVNYRGKTLSKSPSKTLTKSPSKTLSKSPSKTLSKSKSQSSTG